MKWQVANIAIRGFMSCLVLSVGAAEVAGAEHSGDVARLIEDLASVELKLTPVPEDIRLNRVDKETKRKFYETRRLNYQKKKAQIDQATARLAALGDAAVDPVVNRVKAEDDAIRRSVLGNRAVDVLERVGTRKSREALAGMLLGRNGFKRLKSSHAFGVFFRIVKNNPDVQCKLDARELLQLSNKKQFVGQVLAALPGVPIDGVLLSQLRDLVESDDYYLRQQAARVMGAAPTEDFAQERVLAIAKSLETVEKLPKAHERLQHDRVGTFADNMYATLAQALAKMKGGEATLREVSEKLRGIPRAWAVSARGYRGDALVRIEIRDIVTDPNMVERSQLRSYALRAIAKIGIAADLPILREVATSDPVVVMDRGGPLLEMIGDRVINNAGKRAVEYDTSDGSAEEWQRLSSRFYPLRSQAQQAILSIEKRLEPNEETGTE